MAGFGVTSTGYVLKTQEVINQELEEALKQVTDPVTGETLNVNLSDPSDIVTQIVSIVSEQIADGFLVDQAAYNQFDPGKATEDALSSLVLINGIFRFPAEKSVVFMNFTGSPSTIGNFQTQTIGALASFTAVSDGEFQITIDGQTEDITGLDFTTATGYNDVASIIELALQAVGTGGYLNSTVLASSDTAPATITITSGTFGDNSTVSVLGTVLAPAGTDVSTITYLNGTNGIVTPGISKTVPAGLQFSNSSRATIWETVNDFTFDLNGEAQNIEAKSQQRGEIKANAGTLTQLISISTIIDTLSNPLPAQPGQNVETDNRLRRRRDLSTFAPSIGLVGSLDANLKATVGVEFSRVYMNIDTIADANGIAPKTVGCVVQGGDDQEIAQVIFERASLGVNFSGNTTFEFKDKLGTIYTIRWYRPIVVPVEIEVNISIIAGTGAFPDDGAEQIKEAIVAYFSGGASSLGITDGFDIVGFPPGQDVLISRLFTPINSVPGHTVNTITMKRISDPPPLTANDIPIAFNEVSSIETDDITIVTS